MDLFLEYFLGPLVVTIVSPQILVVMSRLFSRTEIAPGLTSWNFLVRPVTVMWNANSRDVERSGRVPLQVSRHNWMRSKQLFDIQHYMHKRSSTPKPAFLVTKFNIRPKIKNIPNSWRLTPGGCEAIIRLHKYEDSQHFTRSLKRKSSKGLVRIAVTKVSYFDNPQEPVDYYTIDRSSIPPKSKLNRKIVLRSLRSNISRVYAGNGISSRENARMVIWIFVADEENAMEASEFSLSDGWNNWKDSSNRRTHIEGKSSFSHNTIPLIRDPWIVRTLRLMLIAYLFVVAAVIAVIPSLFNAEIFIKICEFSCITLSVELILAASVAILYGGSHLVRYLLYEHDRPEWVAGTIGCLRDGDILRSGRGDLWDTL